VLDPNELLRDPEDAARRLGRKGVLREDVLRAVEMVRRRRATTSEVDDARAHVKRASREIGQLVAAGGGATVDERKAAVASMRDEIGALEERLRTETEEERLALLNLPNWPADDAPDGLTEESNVVLSLHGPPVESYAGRKIRPHWEIAEELGIYDGKRGAKITGSMFSVLRGAGARLLHALVDYGLRLNRDTYEEVVPPHLVNSDTFTATGHLPKFARDAYQTTEDGLWLIPTGEVPLMGLHRGEILALDELPKRYMAYTACFRREAGSAGKDTRGMQRLHEFHKVELVKLCTPEQVDTEFGAMLDDALRPIRELGLTHRIVDLAAGDLTFASARIFDIEVYAPGVDRWLEVSSVGRFTDFQARRGNIRYRTAAGKPSFVHALNGSAMATPRMWAALLEVGQRPDGSIALPEQLHDYMGQAQIPVA
jgi:seryl-tRNA synthetase